MEENVSLAIDAVLVVIVLACTVWGLKKGFVKSLLGFIGYVVALLAAIGISNWLAAFVYDGFLREVFIQKISSVLTDGAASTAAEQAEKLLEALPGFVANALGNQGLTAESLEGTLTGSVAVIAPQVADMISPVVINLMRIIFTVVLFSALLFLVRVLVKAVGSVFRLPVLRQMDSLLGGAFGLLSGFVFVLLLTAILGLAVPMMKEDTAAAWQGGIQNSHVMKLADEYNPLQDLFKD